MFLFNHPPRKVMAYVKVKKNYKIKRSGPENYLLFKIGSPQKMVGHNLFYVLITTSE